MLNSLWPFLIIISFMYAIICGNIQLINDSIFKATEDAINLAMTLLGTICLWNGIMKVAMNTSIIEYLAKVLKPLITKIFVEINPKSKAYKAIFMNIIANILGLGNAATPLGLKAMKYLKEENSDKSKLSNSMAMLIVLNTASIQIIPTTVLAIRKSVGTNNLTSIFIPIWIATAGAAIASILVAKILMRRY